MDSGALAPDEIQRQRREVQLKAMKEAVVEDLQPVRAEDGEGSPFDPGADLNTAPLVWRSPTKDTKQESQESQGDQEEGATGLPMVPPPTPFRLSVAAPTMEPATSDMPEMLATPGPDDEDDDLMAVLRFLASSP